MKGGGEGQQMTEMILNKRFSSDNSKTSEWVLKRGTWKNYCHVQTLVWVVWWGSLSTETNWPPLCHLPLFAPEFKKWIAWLRFFVVDQYDQILFRCSKPTLIVVKISVVKAARVPARTALDLDLPTRGYKWDAIPFEQKCFYSLCCSFLWSRKITLYMNLFLLVETTFFPGLTFVICVSPV